MTETFRVIFQTVPPRPSWTAFRNWRIGTLTVESDHARFVPKKGEPVLIGSVLRVSMGGGASVYGEPLPVQADTYIEVLYGDRAEPLVAYFNDGNWWIMGVVSFSRRKMLRALSALVTN